MCSGDRYLDLVTAVEDPAQGTLDTTAQDAEQIQVSRHLYLVLVMLTEDAHWSSSAAADVPKVQSSDSGENAGEVERSVTGGLGHR